MIASRDRRCRLAGVVRTVAGGIHWLPVRGLFTLRPAACLLFSSVLVCFIFTRSSAAPPPGGAEAVFVANNSGVAHIDEFTSTGVLLRTLSGGPASSSYRGLAFGADGYLYVTNTFTCSNGVGSCNELEKYDPSTGAYVGPVGFFTAPATSSNGLTLGPDKDLYVTTNGNGLYKIDPVANTTVAISTCDCGTYGVAVLPDGTPLAVGVSQNRVVNDLTGTAFNTGFFAAAQAIAFGPDGRLYVLEYHQIDTVPSAGGAFTPLTAANVLGLGFFFTFDRNGNIWVTDLDNGVVEFDSVTGQKIASFANYDGSEAGGIAVGPMAGNVWGWGYNQFGELGNGTTTSSATPVLVSNLSNVTTIAGGHLHSLALRSDGTVWSWGHNTNGQLGNGTMTDSSTPLQVSNLSGVLAIAGYDHSLALTNDGSIWGWGSNAYGQLGNGTTTDKPTPVQVSGLTAVVAIAAGGFHSLALKNDGTVWVWGRGDSGQLGNSSNASSSTPVQVSGLTGVVAIAAGAYDSVALRSDGTVWTWGTDGPPGALGTTTSTTPIQVSGLSSVTAIGAGFAHFLALRSDGSVWAWGDNEYGELGNGTTSLTPLSTPAQVGNLPGAVSISGEGFSSLALKGDGTVWAWGYNGDGELGNGTTTNSNVPLQSTLTGVVAIAGGYAHALALKGQAIGPATQFSVSAPTSATVGTALSFTVTALDASNNTAIGYAGTVHFTSTDGLAVLSADYTFTAGDGGTHVFSGTTLNTSGSQTITATDIANTTMTGVSNAIAVSAPPATHFAVAAPASATAGTAFSFAVTALTAGNSAATGYTGTVHFTSTDGLAVLPADYTFTAGDGGTHVFSGTTLNTLGSQTITATDTANATITGTSNAIAVSGPPPTHFAVAAPASATAGTAFSFAVTALTAGNSAATGYTGTVHFTSTDGLAVLPADYTFTAGDGGTHVFSGTTLNTLGSQTITATDTANATITGTSNAITVSAPAPPPPVQITDNEPITVNDTESFPDVFDPEMVHVTDAVTITPLIGVSAPVVSFSVGALGFNGQSGNQTIAVSDIGLAPLILASATISGSSQFAITQTACSNGATSFSTVLPSGGACIFTIAYTASPTPANDNGTLVFNDNAALSNLPTATSGSNYTQSVPLSGAGTTTAPPPPPPATVSVVDNEPVHVTDTESFPDVFDSEKINVTDSVVVAACVLNVSASGQVQARLGTRGLVGRNGTFAQQIVLTNTSGTPVVGPIYIMIENLSGATMTGASGVTSCNAPPGTPFLGLSGTLNPGTTTETITLLKTGGNSSVTLTPVVLAGSGAP